MAVYCEPLYKVTCTLYDKGFAIDNSLGKAMEKLCDGCRYNEDCDY